jgi:hypothetical protein
MAVQRNREEVVNTQFAILISTLGVTADAETIHVHGQHRPDVLFQLTIRRFGDQLAIAGKAAWRRYGLAWALQHLLLYTSAVKSGGQRIS